MLGSQTESSAVVVGVGVWLGLGVGPGPAFAGTGDVKPIDSARARTIRRTGIRIGISLSEATSACAERSCLVEPVGWMRGRI
jgi:hypothetical protein